jgi:hypothetical protein
MASLKARIGLMRCSKCEKLNKGIELFNALRWGDHISNLMAYDKEANEILINEDELMRLIQVVNPLQKARPIRLLSFADWKEARRKNAIAQRTEG